MPFDPCLSLIHTPPGGRELFLTAVPRAAARSEAPPTPVLQYAGMLGERFQMGTVFEDRDQMADMFMSYTLPEGQQAMVEEGVAVDLTREELEVEHVFVEDDVVAVPYGLHPAGATVASVARGAGLPPADYWQLVDTAEWFERSIEGRLAHMAFLADGEIRIVDFWSDRELGQMQHRNQLASAYEADWIALDHFMVGAGTDERARRFVRRIPGSIPG